MFQQTEEPSYRLPGGCVCMCVGASPSSGCLCSIRAAAEAPGGASKGRPCRPGAAEGAEGSRTALPCPPPPPSPPPPSRPAPAGRGQSFLPGTGRQRGQPPLRTCPLPLAARLQLSRSFSQRTETRLSLPASPSFSPLFIYPPPP